MRKSILTLALAVSAIAFTSCDEESLPTGQASDKIAKAFLELEGTYLNAMIRVDQALKNEDVRDNGSAVIDQANVTYANNVLVLDFGNTNKLCADNKQRRGKISATINGDYLLGTGSFALSFDGFHVDDKSVGGDFGLSNTGVVNGQPSFNLSLVNGNYNNQYTFAFQQAVKWNAGFETAEQNDDSFDLSASSGSGSMVEDGETSTFTFNIPTTSPLTFRGTCAQRVETGIINLTGVEKEQTTEYEVDFLQACGSTIQVKVMSGSTQITLPIQFDGF